jgi:hypothetical protein
MRQKIILPIIVLLLSAVLPSYQADNYISVFDDRFWYSLNYALLDDSALNADAFACAFLGLKFLSQSFPLEKPHLLTIIDYSLPSTKERLFVIDLNMNQIIYKSLVAHGQNSGELVATKFSNTVHSHQSSLGFFVTGNTYLGGQGYSMIMNGLDTGFNDHAVNRAIVMHGADYVSERFIKNHGRIGRSYGCPAVPEHMNTGIINLIKEGSVIFCYYPDSNYIGTSTILNGDYRLIN